MDYFQCQSCGNKSCCNTCARINHQGHNLIYVPDAPLNCEDHSTPPDRNEPGFVRLSTSKEPLRFPYRDNATMAEPSPMVLECKTSANFVVSFTRITMFTCLVCSSRKGLDSRSNCKWCRCCYNGLR
jgi:hypothetical protein